MLDAIDVVGIAHSQDVPTIAEEPGRNIFRERDPRISLDGDVVVVIDPTEIVETQVPSQRCCLGCDTFHQTAVAANRIAVVVKDVEPWPVVTVRQPFLSNSHAHAGGNSLPSGP